MKCIGCGIKIPVGQGLLIPNKETRCPYCNTIIPNHFFYMIDMFDHREESMSRLNNWVDNSKGKVESEKGDDR